MIGPTDLLHISPVPFYLRVVKLKSIASQYPFTQTTLINLAEGAKFLTCIQKALYLTVGQATTQKPPETYLTVFLACSKQRSYYGTLKMGTKFLSKYFAIYYSHTSNFSKICSESPITTLNY
jgi:hypothetical protein